MKKSEILPLACEWVKSQEDLILKKGACLSPLLYSDAIKAGVANPNKVRILVVPEIPIPSNPILSETCRLTGLLTTQTGGLTLCYGIYIRHDCVNNRKLNVHELVHVAQYEELGGIGQFLKKYLLEVAEVTKIGCSYSEAPYGTRSK